MLPVLETVMNVVDGNAAKASSYSLVTTSRVEQKNDDRIAKRPAARRD